MEDKHDDAMQACWEFCPELPIRTRARTVYLQGYYMAYQYAAAVEAQLRRQFVLRSPPEGRNLERLRQILEMPSAVSVHLRGGDFKKFCDGKHLLPATYYRNAMQLVEARVPAPTYFVFSNDEEFARQTIPNSGNVIFVNHNDDSTCPTPWLDLENCDDIVLPPQWLRVPTT